MALIEIIYIQYMNIYIISISYINKDTLELFPRYDLNFVLKDKEQKYYAIKICSKFEK